MGWRCRGAFVGEDRVRVVAVLHPRVACQATDYYLGHGEAPGRWHGRGLAAVGLEPGLVVSEQQARRCSPAPCTRAPGSASGVWRKDGVTGFDLTFSAPKTCSALWAMGSGEVAAAVKASHQAAVQAGLAYLDTYASRSRRGTNGVEQITSDGLAVALFDHRTSREGTLEHTHALVVNKVRCTDGTWRTLDAKDLFGHKKSAGMIYQAALRNELHQRLDVQFGDVNEHGQAEILGMPTDLCKLWSKRTTAIDAEAAPKIIEYERLLGRTLSRAERAAVVKTAVLKTRPGKTHPEPQSLQQGWTAEAARAGWTPEQVLRAVGPLNAVVPAQSAGSNGHDETARVLAALQAAGQRQAVFSRADVAGQVAAHLPTSGLTASEVVAKVEALTDQALALVEAVPVGAPVRGGTPRASDARYATVQVLSAEARILALARQGRLGGYGRVPDERVKLAAAQAGRLDPDQQYALGRLTGGGDFLSVLTAPAGAGKTSTLGAASQAWEQSGYRVIGLAPSARAAAELAAATGSRTDTLAKWLHNQTRLHQLPPAEQAWSRLHERTVLILDEASMASTLDLDTVTRLAAAAATKVVLVGDPGQIGVINGPGGMLAALAHAGHGLELGQIHRFTSDWERQASLDLRRGDPAVLGVYGAYDRLHPCADGDTALDQVFTHWTRSRAAGQDALMLARTRLDVDALNTRARAAALATGQVHGPVTRAGERDWQAGDLLRTRRNNRRLTLAAAHASGDPGQVSGHDAEHVRNGDRFRVLGPGSAGGLFVEDLTGRGRVILPADYLEHVEYGWASTIDSAQGATADLGLVLVRPGMDREHLYVAMTRGRHGNHAYVTPDPTHDPEHQHGHGHGAGRDGHVGDDVDLREQTMWVLRTAAQQSGAQDAAHTVLASARVAGADLARAAAETARRQAAQAEARRRAAQPQPLPPEYRRTLQELSDRRAVREQLHGRQGQLQQTLEQAQQQLAALPRWARQHRRDTLTTAVNSAQQQLGQLQRLQSPVEAEIDRLTLRAEHQARERDNAAGSSAAVRRAWADTWDGTGLTRPTPSTAAALHALATRGADRPTRPGPDLPPPYRGPEPPRGPGRSR